MKIVIWSNEPAMVQVFKEIYRRVDDYMKASDIMLRKYNVRVSISKGPIK